MDDTVSIGIKLNNTFNLIIIILFLCYFSNESFVPRLQFTKWSLFIQTIYYHLGYISRIIIRNKSAPTWSNSFASVYQTHWNNGDIVFRLNKLAVVFNVGKSVVVMLRINEPCYFIEVCEDVSCTSVIFSSLVSWTKLSVWHQQIYIVWSYEILSHIHDSHGEWHLAVVICRMLCNVTG